MVWKRTEKGAIGWIKVNTRRCVLNGKAEERRERNHLLCSAPTPICGALLSLFLERTLFFAFNTERVGEGEQSSGCDGCWLRHHKKKRGREGGGKHRLSSRHKREALAECSCRWMSLPSLPHVRRIGFFLTTSFFDVDISPPFYIYTPAFFIGTHTQHFSVPLVRLGMPAIRSICCWDLVGTKEKKKKKKKEKKTKDKKGKTQREREAYDDFYPLLSPAAAAAALGLLICHNIDSAKQEKESFKLLMGNQSGGALGTTAKKIIDLTLLSLTHTLSLPFSLRIRCMSTIHKKDVWMHL